MRRSRAARVICLAAVLLLAHLAWADLPSLEPLPAFSELVVTPLRLNGPTVPGGTTGLEILEADTMLNNQFLPAGTILVMCGTVRGGQNNRVYAVDPNDGTILPDRSVTYAPAAATGKPDAGMVFVPGSQQLFLGMQYSPMAVFLGELQEDGPGALHDYVNLPTNLFPNGGGIGLMDDDTLYITSWQNDEFYTADFSIVGNALSLGPVTYAGDTPSGPGPDGIAVIPPNAAGPLADYAGNLILARFSGSSDGFLDIIDDTGNFLARVARYRKNDSMGFIGPDGLTFGPDGKLYLSDFDQTIFKIAIPEPGTGLLVAVALLPCLRLRRTGK